MNGFYETKLGSVVIFQRGFDITKKEQTPGSIQIISSSGPSSTHNKYKVLGPGVIIGRKGTLGTVHFSEENFWPHDTTLWVKDFKGNNPKFVYYFLQTLKLENFDTGSSNPTLNRNHIHKIKIIFADFDTQKKIAAILSAYDDLIENNKRRIALLEKMAEEIYREWFVRFRFPGYQTAEFEKGIPKGWGLGCIGDLYNVKSGYAFKSSELKPSGLYPVIKIGNINESGVSLDGCQFYDGEIDSRISKYELFTGDLLVAMTGAQIGKSGIFHNSTERSFLNQRVGKFFSKHADLVSNNFINLFGRTGYFREAIEITSHGAAQPNISGTQIEKIELLLPPINLIFQFEEFSRPIFNQISLLKSLCKNLDKTKNLLLPRLISGKLSVENLDIHFPPSMQEQDKAVE